jgi:hypothetical protein
MLMTEEQAEPASDQQARRLRRERFLRRTVVITVCALAAIVFWYGTANGIGLSPDSAFYIKTFTTPPSTSPS